MEDKKSKLEKIVDVIKVVGYIIGGVWVIYLYFSHEKELKNIETDKGRLEIKKDSLDIIKYEQEYLKGRQDYAMTALEFKYSESIKKAELKALHNQDNSNIIELKYKDLENQLDIQKSKYALDQATLDIKGKEIENELNKIKLQYIKDRKIDGKLIITPVNLGPDNYGKNVYKITTRFDVVNLSDVELEVSMVAIELYLNLISYDYLKHDSIRVATAAGLPNIFNSTEYWGGISLGSKPRKMDALYARPSDWKRIAYDCGIFAKSVYFLKDSSNENVVRYLRDKFYSEGSFCTNILKPKESTYFEKVYYIRAVKNNLVGLTVNIVLNKGVRNEDLQAYSSSKALD